MGWRAMFWLLVMAVDTVFYLDLRIGSLGLGCLLLKEIQSMDKVNLVDKLARFEDHWSPKIVGELNGQLVKLVKLQGEFVWHKHDHEDELFLVVKGHLKIRLRERDIDLDEGEFFIVPRGVEHQPVAVEEVHVVLFEPASTLNTGNQRNERTVEQLERI